MMRMQQMNSRSLQTKRTEKKKAKDAGGFQEKTATAEEGERKFKGWSDDGHKAFVQHTEGCGEWQTRSLGEGILKGFCDATRGKHE
jgi:hypothetical protein